MTALLLMIAMVAIAIHLARQGGNGLQDYSQSNESIDAILKRLEKELQGMAGDIPAQVARRQKICRDLGVDELALHIYDEIKHYSAWITTGPAYVCPAVRNPKSKKAAGCTWESFTFDLKERSYGMEFEQRGISLPDGDYADHAHLKLFEFLDGKEQLVLEVSAAKDDPHSEFEKYHPFSIDAFIPGRWITDFFELKDLIRLHDEKRKQSEKNDPAKLAEQKRKFGL